jgi:hypothetical protein
VCGGIPRAGQNEPPGSAGGLCFFHFEPTTVFELCAPSHHRLLSCLSLLYSVLGSLLGKRSGIYDGFWGPCDTACLMLTS